MTVEGGNTNKTKTERVHYIWQYKESKYLFMQKFIQEEIKTNPKDRIQINSCTVDKIN